MAARAPLVTARPRTVTAAPTLPDSTTLTFSMFAGTALAAFTAARSTAPPLAFAIFSSVSSVISARVRATAERKPTFGSRRNSWIDRVAAIDDALRDHEVVALRLRVGLDFLHDRALHALQFLVLAQLAVFLEFLRAPLEVQLLVAEVALLLRALGLGHRGLVALELLHLALELLALGLELLLARAELGLESRRGGLGLRGFREQPVVVDDADLRLGVRGGHGQQAEGGAREQDLEGLVHGTEPCVAHDEVDDTRGGTRVQNAEPIENWKPSFSSPNSTPDALLELSGTA